MGQRGAHTCDVIFEDCRVPAANLIGGVEGRGFKTAMKVLDKGRLHIAAVCVGVAERMLADALAYATQAMEAASEAGRAAAPKLEKFGETAREASHDAVDRVGEAGGAALAVTKAAGRKLGKAIRDRIN